MGARSAPLRQWVRRFILYHGKRHPSELGATEVQGFLDHLARDRGVSASTQNQALAALVFLYNDVLAVTLEKHIALVRAQRPERIPVVLTAHEVSLLLAEMNGTVRLCHPTRRTRRGPRCPSHQARQLPHPPPRTCSSPATTSAPSKSSSATATSPPP
jgi:hypothetical protein